MVFPVDMDPYQLDPDPESAPLEKYIRPQFEKK